MILFSHAKKREEGEGRRGTMKWKKGSSLENGAFEM